MIHSTFDDINNHLIKFLTIVCIKNLFITHWKLNKLIQNLQYYNQFNDIENLYEKDYLILLKIFLNDYKYEINLRVAIKHGSLKIVKYLHRSGEDIRAENVYAIVLASLNGHLKVVKYLHTNGADIRVDNDYAIRWASSYGHFEVVKYLHINGANIRAKNDRAIRLASNNGHLEVVEYLRSHGSIIET